MSHTEIAAFAAEKNSAKPEPVIAAQTMTGDGLELLRFPLAWSVATFVMRAHWKRGLPFLDAFFGSSACNPAVVAVSVPVLGDAKTATAA
ncbi:hypothetical protein G6L97_22125 [Agrobacterium tumefaciens]|uniref:hypothetical protein n=1 Tax=Agrobacterium tumefaciens TaxID=358 RepID=UPI001F23D002|nr:hypothetical protein [Agrobacterium tumefaciens]WCA72318.1 hypothetical protein G6L97_22125 [Agrobacterium tumefaciens]